MKTCVPAFWLGGCSGRWTRFWRDAFSTLKYRRRAPGGLLVFALVLAVGCVFFALPCQAQSVSAAPIEERTLFTNSIVPIRPDIANSMQAETQESMARTLEFEIPLRMRNYPRFLDRIAQGQPVAEAEMERDYLPLQSDYTAVMQWLKSEGFTITQTDPHRLGVFAQGALAQIQKSLQVEMVQVTVGGVRYHAAHTHPSLPKQIAAPVLGINGLQPFLRAKKHQSGPLPQTANAAPYLINELLGAYNGKGLGVTGSGQKIGIVIDTAADDADLTGFWSANGITRDLSSVETVYVNGSILPAPSGEETLDEEWSSGIAPGAGIRVYATTNLYYPSIDKAFLQIINDVSGPTPAEPQLHQVSISLGEGEVYLLAGSQMQTDSQYFATLANAGVSVFVSTGDNGSNPDDYGNSGGPLQAEYYSSDPNVTAVGGTVLKLNTLTGQVATENGWSGSGGGVSQYFSRPKWQVGAGLPAGTMRSTPDVSLASTSSTSDPSLGAYVYFQGSGTPIGGTSWASPTWAGFCALINEARAKASLPPIGLLNPKIYPLQGTSNFRDITAGSNGHYTAAAGYDNVTGLGVPNLSKLIQTLSSTKVPPIVSYIDPSSGWTGEVVTINGLNLTGATAVQFNGTTAPFSVSSDSQITATVPVGATSGPVSVTNPFGTGTSAASFTVVTGTSTTSLYSTGFELSDGYNANANLAGQNGWQIDGSGGNGVVTELFPGQGNQGYIGGTSPIGGGNSEALWPPINYTPLPGDVVTFSVQMDILDSTNRHYDTFRWSVNNISGIPLFSIDFNNLTNAITYKLDNKVSYNNDSALTLLNGTIYTLLVTIDFAHNTWSATLNGSKLATNRQITTTGANLTLGEIKANWLISGYPAGDNYMLFDNYGIFITAPMVPAAMTGSATGITYSGATLNGAINPRGLPSSACFRYWSALTSGTTPIQVIGSGTTTTAVSAAITGLTPKTLYHSQLVATANGGTALGPDQTFTTTNPPPTVTTGTAAAITDTGAVLYGTVNPNGLATTVYFEYGTDSSYGIVTASQNAGAGASAINFSAAIGPLVAFTTYHYRSVATNSSGTSYGDEHLFNTLRSANANLSAVALSSGTFSPVFSVGFVSYNCTVSNTVTSITVTPVTSNSNATVAVRVNGGSYTPVPSGTPSVVLPLNVGANTIDVTTTAQNGTTVKIVTLTVTRLKSAIADLSSLALNVGTFAPAFSPDVIAYSGTVPSSIATVTAVKADAGATVQAQVNSAAYITVNSGTASGPLPLKMGTNTINIKVTAATGTTIKSYALALTRVPSSNADLSGLAISTAPISPLFTSANTAYSASIANIVPSVTVKATKSDPGATIILQVNGGVKTALSSSSASAAQALKQATNGIAVNVTAEDGTLKSYTINVSRVVPPVITPPNVGSSEAILNAATDPRSTSALFQYGLTSAYGVMTSPLPITSGSVGALVTGLDPATVYHYRVAVTTGSSVDYSSPDATFLTGPTFPITTARDNVVPQFVPQVSGSAFRFVAFGVPAINDLGHTAFEATISGTAISAVAYPALFIDTGTSGGLVKIAGANQAAPGWQGISGTSGTFATLGDPVFNNNDAVAFQASLKITGTVTAANYQGIWANTSGTLALVARQGQTLIAPAPLNGAKFASFTQLVLPDNGGPMFLATLAISGSISSKNNQGIWSAEPNGQLNLLLRTGDLLAGGTISSLTIFDSPATVAGQTRDFSTAGELVFGALFTSGSQGIFVRTADSNIWPIAGKTGPAPGTTGTAVTFLAFRSPAISDLGHAVFQATLSGSGISTANNAGIWVESGTAFAVLGKVTRIGDPAPGRSGSTGLLASGTFATLNDPVVNGSDNIAFIGTLKVAGTVTAANSQGIWANTSGTMALIVRAQDPAPGCPAGAKFSLFTNLVLPDQGGVVFLANLVGGLGGVTAANYQGIWAADTTGQLSLVARTGDVHMIGGKQRIVSALSLFTSSPGTTAQTRSFNGTGGLIYKATFTDGTQAIFEQALR